MSAMRDSYNQRRGVTAIIVLCTGLFTVPALAGGIMAYEVGTADVGFASAGFAAG